MLNYPKILSEVMSAKWAIRPEALQSILGILQNNSFAEADREIFHKATEESKKAFTNILGKPLEGYTDTYIKGNTGVFILDGPIIPRSDFFSEISGMVSTERLTKNLQKLQSDRNVEKIIMMIDSPGGYITGVSEFSQLVKKSEKPVTAYVYGSADSAAFWIATGARKIYVADTADLGSVGVVSTWTDNSEAMKNRGYQKIEIVSSLSPDKRVDPKTPEGQDKIRVVLDQLMDVFVSHVSENRSVSAETVVNDFGQGSVKIGQVAVDAGMADGVISFDSLLNNYIKTNGPGPENLNLSKTEDTAMDPKENKTPTAAGTPEPKTEKPAAVDTEKLKTEAAADTVARIKGIESLLDQFKESPAAVKKAARKVVDSEKFKPEATKENVSAKLLAAVVEAQNKTGATNAEEARKLAAEANEIPDSPDDEPEDPKGSGTAEKQLVQGLCDGMK